MSKSIEAIPEEIKHVVKDGLGNKKLVVKTLTEPENVWIERIGSNPEQGIKIEANLIRNLVIVLEDALRMIDGKIEELEDENGKNQKER